MQARRKLIVVSNRGPTTFARDEGGERITRRGGGGLVTALRSLVSHHDVTWIASAISEEDHTVAGEAFDEAFVWINADKRRAAKLYIEMTKEKKLTEDELTASFSGKDMEYTKVPSKVGKLLDFLHR